MPRLPRSLSLVFIASAIASAGCAVETEDDSSAESNEEALTSGRACTTDAQCGGGDAMCFIDRCARVETKTEQVGLHEGFDVAYGKDGRLRLALEVWSLEEGYELSFGRWDAKRKFQRFWGQKPTWSLEAVPGDAPVFSLATNTGGNAGFNTLAIDGNPGPNVLDKRYRVLNVATARNDQGTTFAAYTQWNAAERTDCNIWFASQPAGSQWSAGEKVGPCQDWNDLAVHVRQDGTAEVLASRSRQGGLKRFRRSNPVDGWTADVVLDATFAVDFQTTHGKDGTSHVIAQTLRASSTANGGLPLYEVRYLELGDEGIVRNVALGTHKRSTGHGPFVGIALDARGNVWTEKWTSANLSRPSLVRIDPEGRIAERSIGEVPTGHANQSAFAVSATGEIAVVHSAGGDKIQRRRFIPIP